MTHAAFEDHGAPVKMLRASRCSIGLIACALLLVPHETVAHAAQVSVTPTAAVAQSPWKLDDLLAQPAAKEVLETGQPKRIGLKFGQSRIEAVVSLRPGTSQPASQAVPQSVPQSAPQAVSQTVSQTGLQIGPIWVISIDGLPEIDPLLRSLPFSVVVARELESDDAANAWLVEPLVAGELPSATQITAPSTGQDATCLEPPRLADPAFKFRLAWDDRTSARLHAKAIEGLDLARKIVAMRSPSDTLHTAGEIPESLKDEEQRARLRASANEWLEEPLPLIPPCGSPLIAFVELVDARQAVMRSLGRTQEADTLFRWLLERMSRANLHALVARLSERVPSGTFGFASATFHTCWLTDTGEITAAAPHVLDRQRRFAEDLVAQLQALRPCDASLIEALKEQSERLVGQLPIGARVDDVVTAMLRRRVDDLCRTKPPIDPILVRDAAMACALQAWTAAWTAPGARDPASEEGWRAWHRLIMATTERLFAAEPFASCIPAPEVPPVLDAISAYMTKHLSCRAEYLGAFTPDAQTSQMFEARLAHICGESTKEAICGSYTDYERELEKEQSRRSGEYSKKFLDAALQSMRQEVMMHWASDVLQAMLEIAESSPSKSYPEPFPFWAGSFVSIGDQYNWGISGGGISGPE